MNDLQVSNPGQSENFQPPFLQILLFSNFIALLVTFALNFAGLSILKYHYLIHIAITVLAIFLYEIPQIFPIILTLFFIEGQGRIIWKYMEWARIIFDVLLLMTIIKIFVKNKKIIDLTKIPSLLAFFICLHFSWYIVEFFNVNSVSFIAVIGATKLYVFPILLFLGLAQSDFNVGEKGFERNIVFFVLLLVLEMSLNFFQFYMRQEHLLKISTYYKNAIKIDVFTDSLFRPFATAQTPGALSAFLFLTVGLLFLKKTSKSFSFLRIILIISSLLSTIICQIRSAFVKYILLILFIQLGKIIFDRFKFKSIIVPLISSLIFFTGIQMALLDSSSTGDIALDYARDRIATLTTPDKLKGARLDLGDFSSFLTSKISQYPLGIGPGLTGPIASLSKKELENHPFLTPDELWTGDNLFVAIVMDFGIGAIFYFAIIICPLVE
jgi:hypothetical protein